MTSKTNFEVNQEVVYLGNAVKGLETGKLYSVESVSSGGGIKVYGWSYYLNANQFVSKDELEYKANEIFNRADTVDAVPKEKEEEVMKFKNKPGSAVIYYKAGSKFHLSQVEEISLDHISKSATDQKSGVGFTAAVRAVSIIRTYQKDGINFTQQADIPVAMLDKIEYTPKHNLVSDAIITVTYNDVLDELVYPVTYTGEVVNLI